VRACSLAVLSRHEQLREKSELGPAPGVNLH